MQTQLCSKDEKNSLEYLESFSNIKVLDVPSIYAEEYFGSDTKYEKLDPTKEYHKQILEDGKTIDTILNRFSDGVEYVSFVEEDSEPKRVIDKFHSVCWNFNVSDIDDYLKDYDWYEIYDPTKEYSTEVITQNGKDYRYKLFNFQNNKQYVVMSREVSDDYQQVLSKYCQCYICTAKWYNIKAYFTCSCCIGCVKSVFPSNNNIKEAEAKFIEDMNEKATYYNKIKN